MAKIFKFLTSNVYTGAFLQVYHSIFPMATLTQWRGSTSIPAHISNYFHYKVGDEITYPFPNFNGATVEVLEWISNFITHFTGYVKSTPGLKSIQVCKTCSWDEDHLHDDVIKWQHFSVTGHLCGEFTGHRWIPHTKASDAELWCFLWSAPESTLE